MPWREADYPRTLHVVNLRKTSAWVRDTLDPLMARDGPSELHPDDVLTLHDIFLALQHHQISLATMQFSRIHLAVSEVCGKATRWPTKLADEADRVIRCLESCYGPLETIQTPLYEVGGRLHGISEPRHLTRDALLRRFSEEDPSLTDNTRAYFHNSLGFKPGQWWINGLFAFRDGIINDKCTEGGICHNELGAYAVVLKDDDEANSLSPDRFTYRCRTGDRGRYRLTAADFRSRFPVRVLRSNSLRSLWAPRAGIRYDGLFQIKGWTIRPVKAEENEGVDVMFDVHFERCDGSDSVEVLRHPLAEEVDDYKAYKRCCREQRDAERHDAVQLGSLNYRATSEMNLSEKDFQEQFQSPSQKAKDEDYVLRDGGKPSRTPSLHREEVVDFTTKMRTYDGSTEDSPRFHEVEWNPPSQTSFAKGLPRVARLAAGQHSLQTEARATPSQWTRSLSTTASVHTPALEKLSPTARVLPFPTSPQSRVSRLEALQEAKPFSQFLTDNFNRQHDYLRISITERCNLRCVYCMPAEGVPLSPTVHLLTTPEIFYLSSLFVSQGVTKIRLTGGEPTVRKDIIPLMQQVGSLRSKGLREIALTTNGLLLHRKLDAMVEAGLTAVNMSLDTLDPFQFQIMTRRKGFDVVMRGIDRILEMNKMGAGVKLKINCVVMRGVNEREILPFVEMGMEKDIEVRFIEYMPFGGNKWSKGKMLSYQEMLDIIRTKYPGVHRVQGHKNDTSKTFQVPGFVGRIGFITSMTEDFCSSCNRLRITGDGNLKVCLHGNAEVSLRDILREGNDGKPIDEEAFEAIKQIELDRHQGRLPEGTPLGWGEREQSLLNLIGTAVKRKKEKHAGIGELENMENRPMILIGG
ncbi:hypothetical protein EG328_006829 [Venturia inaequalis]|uniref:GTP 3',8-cyclase n=1 Tax=Venturia inaequalis TaxID=5025 RepID=A0A8H3YUD4_VENIN|nr:hypothetical protein EG328_006829 [Venturia inaequalis]